MESGQMSEGIAEIRNEIELLRQRNRQNPDPHVELSLQKLRLAAGDLMVRSGTDSDLPLTSVPDVFSDCKGLPDISANDFSAETLASGVLHYGGIIVRGLYNKHQTDHLFELAMSRPEIPPNQEMFMFASPKEAFELLEIFDDSGMMGAIRTYHGGASVIMAERLKLSRRLAKSDGPGGIPWHQDINYFGTKCFAINCWAAVTPCGVDNPGLGIVAGREEASIGWRPESGEPSLSTSVDALADKMPEILRRSPEICIQFRPGDAVFFDEMTVHRTSIRPFKIPQQIITTSWFFSPALAPKKITPLAAL